MKTNHYQNLISKRIVRPSKHEMLAISKMSNDRGPLMTIMIFVTLGLLGLVAANEYTDH